MSEPIREEGFLFIESDSGGMVGWSEFCDTMEKAESLAKNKVRDEGQHFPVLIVPVIRFTTERIRQFRGDCSS